MDEERLKQMLADLAGGRLTVTEAFEKLGTLPFLEAGEVLADTHRLIRQGFPEAVFAEGKTVEQVTTALTTLALAHGAAMATRVNAACGKALLEHFPAGVYVSGARLFTLGTMSSRGGKCKIGVVCAGTSDLTVAEEAVGVLQFGGWEVTRIWDVGVAGLHRLLARLDDLRACKVLIVVAGMEGALPSVVGGLVRCPVIAVPTSVGYGTAFGGVSALLTMLNSCASGVTVVNIDNGYGAAIAAQRILEHCGNTTE